MIQKILRRSFKQSVKILKYILMKKWFPSAYFCVDIVTNNTNNFYLVQKIYKTRIKRYTAVLSDSNNLKYRRNEEIDCVNSFNGNCIYR